MARFPFAVVAVLVAVIPGDAADPVNWGPTVNGLRMSVAIDGNAADAELRIVVKNMSDKPLLLPVGNILNSRIPLLRFQLLVTTHDGKDEKVIFTGEPGVISGRLDPLVVPMIPNASYAVQRQIARYYVLDRSEKLQTIMLQPCQLRVEFEIQDATCTLYVFPNPTAIACWQGKVVSNVLQLPN
jgi:hypothetical protein